MKRILIWGLLALTAGAFAKTTPLGLDVVSIEAVHNKLDLQDDGHEDDPCNYYGRYGAMAFTHGNISVRVKVDNPTEIPQPLTIDIPIRVGYPYDRRIRKPKQDSTYSVVRTIPPGKGNQIEFAIPHVGMMNDFLDNQWEFTDGSGKHVDVDLHFNVRAFAMPSGRGDFGLADSVAYMPSDTDYVVAISPSFKGAPKLHKRVEEFGEKNHGYRRYEIDVNRPDFKLFTDWRDLACYDALIFTTNDWNSYSAEFHECVKDYEAVGGHVIFADTEAEIELKGFFKSMEDVCRFLRGYGCTPKYDADRDSMQAVRDLKNATPFGSIIIVLLVFAIVAGPITIFILAKRGQRIHLLWVFPSIAIVFSVAVALTIVFANGLGVKVKTFNSEIDRTELGRKVLVKNRVFVAPFPMTDAIRCSESALVTVDSGSDKVAGRRIVSTDEDLQFIDGWTPCLWPIRVREVEVIRCAKEEAK